MRYTLNPILVKQFEQQLSLLATHFEGGKDDPEIEMKKTFRMYYELGFEAGVKSTKDFSEIIADLYKD